jgi:hypothetical protein
MLRQSGVGDDEAPVVEHEVARQGGQELAHLVPEA